MNSLAASESTPLLNDHENLTHFPPVDPVVKRILQLERPIVDDDLFSDSANDSSSATSTAYALVVLLECLKCIKESHPTSPDVYNNWFSITKSRTQDNLLKDAITQRWYSFISEYRSTVELDILYWTSFPCASTNKSQLRLADLLASPTAPDALSSHPLTLMMFSHTWKHGSYTHHRNIPGILRKYDATCTPRSIHLLELLSTFIYVGLLTHYVMFPPTQFHTTQEGFGVRECLLITFALSLINSCSIVGNADLLSVILCLGLSFPKPIYADTNLFSLLLFALLWSMFRLYSTYPPTPLLLFPSKNSFPLAVFIRKSLSSTFKPVGSFYAPAFLLLMFLLSYSMADTFPLISANAFLRVYAGPAPMQTRTALFFVLVLLLIISGLTVMVLAVSSPLLVQSVHSEEKWSRFSRPVAIEAQRSFFKCVTAYTKAYAFPAPLNLIFLAFVMAPIQLMVLLRVDFFALSTAERIFWRVTVGPFTTVLASLYGILGIRSRSQ